MEDGTQSRSLHTVVATALGILLIGAGCTGNAQPPQSSSPEASQATSSGALQEAVKKQIPFVACYHGEADLFNSVASVSDAWVASVREQLQDGWLIDTWCKEEDEAGASKYAFAFKKIQGVPAEDLASVVETYQKSGRQDGAPKPDSDTPSDQWGVVKLGYVSSERNRSNEIPLSLSKPVAMRVAETVFDSVGFQRNLMDAASAPRNVVAEMHGGVGMNRFAVRFRYNPSANDMQTESFCRSYFDTKDGSFSPEGLKTSCQPSR
jgi:hypothetical protein